VSGRSRYVRAIDHRWWAHTPYLGYTLREATGVAVAGYGIVLLAGIIALARGQGAYTTWLDFLTSPWSLVLHFVFLVGMVWHAVTWFRIMPKTMPRLVIGSDVVPQRLITGIGLAIAAATFVVTLIAAKWMLS
jgi:succinate dehydrogenase subunit C